MGQNFLFWLLLANYCPTLRAPIHGRINGFRTELHATVGVACDSGYDVKGTSFRTCQKTRQWSGSHPTCERKKHRISIVYWKLRRSMVFNDLLKKIESSL